MNNNYPSAGHVVRNVADLRMPYETLATEGKFRIIELDAPYFSGYKYWIVNEKGFLWESANDFDHAVEYLESEEAKEYQNETE